MRRADYGAELEMRAGLELAGVEWGSGHKDLAIDIARSLLLAAKTREPAAVPVVEAWIRAHGGLSGSPPGGVE